MELNELDRDESHRMEVDRKREGVQSRVGGSLDATGEQTHRTGEERRRATALRIESVAGAAHHAAGDLEDQFPQTARYLHDTAAGLEHLSCILRDPHLDEVATLIGTLGRKQPAAIVAGEVLIGLGLSWFLKNSVDAAGRTAPDALAGEGGAYDIQ
jgi:hypothetical protein